MTETQFAMISEWMVNKNISDFVKAHPDADRLGLVGFSLKPLVSSSLTTNNFPSWGMLPGG